MSWNMSEKPEEKSWSELPTYGREEEEKSAEWGPTSIPTWMSEAETLRPPERTVGIVDDGRTDAARRWKPGETILGRYVVERELGQGGMGVVYGCMDKVGGVRVAVKGLPPELSHDSVEMEEVRANFQLVYGLSHPNIAGVRQLERDGRGEYYLVMEMAEGESLRKWLRRKWKAGGVPLAEAVKVLRQVASALDYAHAKKIVHRDVKPGNVMIDATGEVKVLDFGLAAQIRTSLSRASHAYQGTSGTGPYMSPEQWRGQPQDGKTDQYALGVMAYEMLAGRLPFENAEVGVLREVVLKEDPPTIPGLPGSAMSAIQRAMSKHAEERFSTCGEFVEALTAESQTVRSVKNTDTEPVVGKGKGHGGGWVAALLLAAGVGVGVWWWQDGVGRQRLEEVVRQAEKLRAAQEAAEKEEQERLVAEKKAEEEHLATQKRAEEMESKRKAEEDRRQAAETDRRAQEEAVARKAEEERLAEQRQAARRAAEEVARQEAEPAAALEARSLQELDGWKATVPDVQLQDRDAESAYQEAQMLDLGGDPLGASTCYKRVEDIVSDRGTKRTMRVLRVQMLLKAAEQRIGTDRNRLLDEAAKLCTDLQWGGLDLQFVDSVVLQAYVELARGNREKARNVLVKNMDILKPIDDSLADMGLSMKDSPMAGARSLRGRLLKEDADMAANDPAKTEEALQLYAQALTEYYNVFVKYGDSSWGPSAGRSAKEIKDILENKYGKTVKINLAEQAGGMEFSKADNLFRQQKYDEAATAYQKALEQFPDVGDLSVAARAQLLQCYMNLDRSLDAKKVADELGARFAKKSPITAKALISAGALYDKKGDEAMSKYMFDVYLKYCPDDAQADRILFWLATKAAVAGRMDEAKAYNARIIADYKDSEFYSKALGMLGYYAKTASPNQDYAGKAEGRPSYTGKPVTGVGEEPSSQKLGLYPARPYVLLPDGRRFEGTAIRATADGSINLTTPQGIRTFPKGRFIKAVAADGVTELGVPISEGNEKASQGWD